MTKLQAEAVLRAEKELAAGLPDDSSNRSW
jgi:hypothetical protein